MVKTSSDAKKQELVAELIAARSGVIDAAVTVPVASRDSPFLCIWSAHDIVAHLIGWDHTNLEALASIRAGSLPAFYSEYDADWRTYNARLVEQFKRPTFDQTIDEARASHGRLLAALEALPAGDFIRDYGVRSPRGRRVTIAMLLQAEAADERKHASQVKAFVRQQEKTLALPGNEMG